MDKIYQLKHEVRVIKGKRVMVCIEHFCDIDSMPEGEYYKEKRKQQSESKVDNQ